MAYKAELNAYWFRFMFAIFSLGIGAWITFISIRNENYYLLLVWLSVLIYSIIGLMCTRQNIQDHGDYLEIKVGPLRCCESLCCGLQTEIIQYKNIKSYRRADDNNYCESANNKNSWLSGVHCCCYRGFCGKLRFLVFQDEWICCCSQDRIVIELYADGVATKCCASYDTILLSVDNYDRFAELLDMKCEFKNGNKLDQSYQTTTI